VACRVYQVHWEGKTMEAMISLQPKADSKSRVLAAFFGQKQISLEKLKQRTGMDLAKLISSLNELFLEGRISRQPHFGGHTYIYRLEEDEATIQRLRVERTGR